MPVTTVLRAGLRLSGHDSPWLTKHLPRAGTVAVSLPNGAQLKLWSRGDDWISTQLFWHGMDGYEPETAHVFFRLAQRAALTIDVGAHVGYFTVMAALANPAGRVVAIEPFPPTFERLRRNVAANRLGHVECRKAAAGAACGSTDLHYLDAGDPGLQMAASLEPSHLAAWGPTTMTVPVVRIDDVVAELGLGRVDLIKLDAEGHETSVLAGATETLSRDRPSVICEVLAAAREDARPLAGMLAPLGYRFYELGPAGPRECSEISPGPDGNFLFSVSETA
jgi:FkbM family methyltransferase